MQRKRERGGVDKMLATTTIMILLFIGSIAHYEPFGWPFTFANSSTSVSMSLWSCSVLNCSLDITLIATLQRRCGCAGVGVLFDSRCQHTRVAPQRDLHQTIRLALGALDLPKSALPYRFAKLVILCGFAPFGLLCPRFGAVSGNLCVLRRRRNRRWFDPSSADLRQR